MLHDLGLLCVAIIAALGSPGPVTLSLAGTGATFGARRSLRFLVGILAGLVITITLSAIGVSALLAQGGLLLFAAVAVSITYLGYLAYKIGMAPILAATEITQLQAPRARDGFLVAITNPKAYAVISAIFAGFTLPVEPRILGMVATGAVLWGVTFLIDIAWLMGGQFLMPVFASRKWGRGIRVGFAIIMVLSVLVGFSSFL